MDDSPIPRCNFRFLAVVLCFCLAFVISLQLNVSTYANIDDGNCFSYTSAYETVDIGITGCIGLIIVPIFRCAFFALKNRRRAEIVIVSPPSCKQYARILNC